MLKHRKFLGQQQIDVLYCCRQLFSNETGTMNNPSERRTTSKQNMDTDK